MEPFIPKDGVYFPEYVSLCRSDPLSLEPEDPILTKIYDDIYALIHKFADYKLIKYKTPKDLTYMELLRGILIGWPSCSAIACKSFLELTLSSLKEEYKKSVIELLSKKD